MEDRRRKRQEGRVFGEGTRMSAGNLLHRKGAVNVNKRSLTERAELEPTDAF